MKKKQTKQAAKVPTNENTERDERKGMKTSSSFFLSSAVIVLLYKHFCFFASFLKDDAGPTNKKTKS